MTQKLKSITPKTPIVLGGFNHCSLENKLHQYVTRPSRHNKILEMCYGSVKYKSVFSEISSANLIDNKLERELAINRLGCDII